MRLWSLHPVLLDRQGLLGLWREALLAQKVLLGKTSGYRRHPQLIRFRSCPDPPGAIAAFLLGVQREGQRRGYHLDRTKILSQPTRARICVTQGQVDYELEHLKRKLRHRDRKAYEALKRRRTFSLHPLFRIIPGDVEEWEVRK